MPEQRVTHTELIFWCVCRWEGNRLRKDLCKKSSLIRVCVCVLKMSKSLKVGKGN